MILTIDIFLKLAVTDTKNKKSCIKQRLLNFLTFSEYFSKTSQFNKLKDDVKVKNLENAKHI